MAVALGSGGGSECVVRVNGADSGLMSHDLRAVFGAGQPEPHALMLPKCESVEQLYQVNTVPLTYMSLCVRLLSFCCFLSLHCIVRFCCWVS